MLNVRIRIRKKIPMYPFVGWRIPDSSGGKFIQLVVATALVACSDAHIDITVVGQCPDVDVDVWGSGMLFNDQSG